MNKPLSHQTRLWILFTVSSSVRTYSAGPEEVPSALQHSINVDELALSEGDEPAVSRVIIVQGTSYQDGVCRAERGLITSHSGSEMDKHLVLLTAAVGVSAEFLGGKFRHLLPSFAGRQQEPEGKSEPEFGGHVCGRAPGEPMIEDFHRSLLCLLSPRQTGVSCCYSPSP